MCVVLVSKGVGCFRYRKSEFGWDNFAAEYYEGERVSENGVLLL